MSQHIPDIKLLLQQIIAIPSVSCTNTDIDQSNLSIINYLADLFQAFGFTIEIQAIGNEVEKANLIATIGTGNNGLVLAGHTDTVPYDESQWNSDPFSLTENDNRLYGLGTSDMKSFFALIIEAIRDIDLSKLKQPLIILATADEETSMAGARAIAKQGLNNARHAIIGEPTNMKPVRMHKGMMMESIQLTGLSGHSSNPAHGHNALEAMHKVMGNLLQWRDELQTQYRNPLFAVPVPTINFGHIHGGDNPNRICGACELQIDLRPLPGMSVVDLRHELKQRLSKTLEGNNITINMVSLFEGVDAMETDENARIVRAVEKLTDTTAGTVAFGTEAPYYDQMGIESIVFGPGNIAQAHQPDEYIEIDTISPFVQHLRDLIQKFCL